MNEEMAILFSVLLPSMTLTYFLLRYTFEIRISEDTGGVPMLFLFPISLPIMLLIALPVWSVMSHREKDEE